MSGHSKWSTIKRKKGAADAERGKIFAIKNSRRDDSILQEKPQPDFETAKAGLWGNSRKTGRGGIRGIYHGVRGVCYQ